MAGMKPFLAKTWWLYGVLCALCLGLCSKIGWYALANVAVLGAGLYVVHQASSRKKRIVSNQAVFQAMTRKQKQAFLALDERETRSIRSSSKLMPYLCFGCLLLNGYTYYYNLTSAKSLALIPALNTQAADPFLLGFGLAFGVLFYFAYCFRMNETHIQLELPKNRSMLRKKSGR